MKIKFIIDYRTVFGENLVLNTLADGKVVKQYPMSTTDGHTWTCSVSTTGKRLVTIDYAYSVVRDGKVVRGEWQITPHRFDTALVNATSVTVYDHWRDMGADSYLYSSAMTQCLARRSTSTVAATDFAQSIIIKVAAPQLHSDMRLAIVGSDPELGAWDAAKAVPMTEQAPCEWVVILDAAKLQHNPLEIKFLIVDSKGGVQWEADGNRMLMLPRLKKGEAVAYELAAAGFDMEPWRVAGTVIPVFSLKTAGSFGVGDFGDLQTMIDWVASVGQRALQLLPINDTTITRTWTDSYPYNSISIYALHPMYVDLRQLPELKTEARRKHFAKLQLELNALPQIDYERVNDAKSQYLHELYKQEGAKMLRSAAFKAFFKTNEHWLVPYAAFCYYRDTYGTATFGQWPAHRTFTATEQAAMADPKSKEWGTVAYWYFVQFILDKQMRVAHDHARSKGVILKGDIPIGISRDGVEAWVEPKYFNLNSQAGAPPDAFSTNGQNWGFPTYNWPAMLADGCSWWKRRFTKMAEYFDAYRIDHVLGFFRIWEIPIDAVYGLLGQFSPALGMSVSEIENNYGLKVQPHFTEPYITDWILDRTFGERANEVREKYVEPIDGNRYRMRADYDTQRKVERVFKNANEADKNLSEGLMSLLSNILFLRDHRNPELLHPRIAVQHALIYESLWDSDKQAFNRLYNDYYYHRNNDFWYHEAMKKLPELVQATRMLVCAEDLGMVPDCVPWALDELRILSLEIQSMPKDPHVKFGVLGKNPYRSVATISTHDMPTMRQWWDEDWQLTQEYYNEVLWKQGPAPHPMPGWLAEQVVTNNLQSPSMLCLLSLQDWLAIDDNLRLNNADAERINIPANPRHYWRYRMHMTIEQLQASTQFNERVHRLIANSHR